MSRVVVSGVCLVCTSLVVAAPGDCDWSPLGTGVGPACYAAAVLPNGDAVFGGSITLAGSNEVEHIARWDGAEWHDLGAGVNGFVRTILAMPDGSLIAGGHFTQAGSIQASLIAKWDGTQWSALGQGLDAGSCRALLRTSEGDIIAAGSFLQADNQTAWYIARWDGANWSKMGDTTDGGGVSGYFSVAGEPTVTMVHDLVEMPNGDIIASGNFTHADGVLSPGIARWDGSQWRAMGSGMNGVARAMTVLPSGELLVAGLFGQAGGVITNGLAMWDGSNWSAVGDGLNGTNSSSPFALVTTAQGKVVMSGAFYMVDSVPVNHIAMWDPETGEWSALGSGMRPAIQTTVFAVGVDPRGVIYGAGQFATAGGGNPDAWNVAKFDCLPGCPADFNADGQLDFFDVSLFLGTFTANDPVADFNHDGVWDFFDVTAFLNAFTLGCP